MRSTEHLRQEAVRRRLFGESIDSIAAAATNVKQYTETTVGATTALSPLSFRYIKIVAGTAGAGNTTTMNIAMK